MPVMQDILGSAITYVKETSAIKKIGDAAGVLIMGMVAGILYSGWMAQDEILTALKARTLIVHVSTIKAKEVVKTYWPIVESEGGVGLIIARVDLDRNTTTLLAFDSKADLRSRILEVHRGPHEFVQPDGTGAAFTAALLAGSPYDTELTARGFSGYCMTVPIPNRRGTALAGFIATLWPKAPPDSEIVRMQELMGNMSDELSD